MVLYLFASYALYKLAGIEMRVDASSNLHAIPPILFITLSWISALGFAVVQYCFKGVKLTVSSMREWPWSAWLFGLKTCCTFAYAGILHVYTLPAPWWRSLLPSLTLCLLLLCLCVLKPYKCAIHVHHWFIGMFLATFFQSPRDQLWSSSVAQAVGIGIFVNGIAAWGFAPLIEGIPACDK